MSITSKNTRVSSVGIIIDKNDRILLCRLSKKVLDGAGKWTLPGGGIDFGEDPKDALVREVKEETGLNAQVKELLDISSEVVSFRDNREGTHDVFSIHAVRIIYSAEVESGNLKVEQDGSTDACAWFSYAEAIELPLTNLAYVGVSLWAKNLA